MTLGRRIDAPTGTRELSAAELVVLRALSYGLTYGDVAAWLGRSRFTVQTHVRRLLRKLDAVNTAHAVRVGFETGLLDVADEPPTARRALAVDLADLEDEVDEPPTRRA